MSVGTPTWPNHPPIIRGVGLEIVEYPYYDRGQAHDPLRRDDCGARRARGAGDVVLLHGCCHNPTGADLDARTQWAEVTPASVPSAGCSRSSTSPTRASAAASRRMRRGCAACCRSCDEVDRRAELRQEFQRLSRPRRLACSSRPAQPRRPPRRWRMSSSAPAKCGRCRPTMAPPRCASCSTTPQLTQPTGWSSWMRCATASTRSASGIAAADPRLAFIGQPVRHVLDAAAQQGAGRSSCAKNHAIYMADSGRFNVVGMGDDQIDRFIAAVVEALGA